MAGILNPSEYMTHTAYVTNVTSLDMFGVPSGTSVVSFDCLAYQHSFFDQNSAPMGATNYQGWFLLIPNTIVVTVNDTIKQVLNDLGDTVMPDAIVRQVQHYDHWEYRSRFKILLLDVARDG